MWLGTTGLGQARRDSGGRKRWSWYLRTYSNFPRRTRPPHVRRPRLGAAGLTPPHRLFSVDTIMAARCSVAVPDRLPMATVCSLLRCLLPVLALARVPLPPVAVRACLRVGSRLTFAGRSSPRLSEHACCMPCQGPDMLIGPVWFCSVLCVPVNSNILIAYYDIKQN